MKYEQPYGVSDPNASYINGNPSTGTMGSIPPAASIENPQREIVNFETDSGLTPTDADLHQLAKSVQSGHVNYCPDQGSANFIAITPTPAVAAYAAGLHFRVKVAANNTAPVQVNVSNVGWTPLIHGVDKSSLGAGELTAGQIIEITFDGTKWQILSGGGGAGGGGLIFLTAPLDIYVNATTGDDTAYDGSAATVATTHGPFKTIQKALSTMTKYNLSGQNFNIHIADGSYINTTTILVPGQNGAGSVVLIGNVSNPRNVVIMNTGTGSAMLCLSAANYYFKGLSFQSTAGAPGDPGNGVWWQGTGCNLILDTCAFGNVAYAHIASGVNAAVSVTGSLLIYGSAGFCLSAGMNSTLLCNQVTNPLLTISALVNIGNFAMATDGAIVWPIFGTITGFGNVTGTKYYGSSNGVINAFARGASYLPGTVGGSVNTGGQYL